MKQKALAQQLNQPLSWVRARIAIVALPVEAQAAIDAGELEVSDALKLAPYADQPDIIAEVLGGHWRGDLDWRLRNAVRDAERRTTLATAISEYEAAGIVAMTATPAGARALDALGLVDRDHRQERCHFVVVGTDYNGAVRSVAHCAEPTRHAKRGDSDLKTTGRSERPRSEAEQESIDAAKATKVANTHRNAFARDAIEAKLRRRDITDFVLPALFACAGQTEITEAAKLLQVVEPTKDAQSSYRDWSGPFRQWAGESQANLTRAMLAIAYVQAVAAGAWRPRANEALAGWLDRLGYKAPEPEA